MTPIVDTAEQNNLSLKQGWKSRVCTNIFPSNGMSGNDTTIVNFRFISCTTVNLFYTVSTVCNWLVSHAVFGGGVDLRPKQTSSSKENPTMISNHLLKPLVSSTPKKNITRCLDLFDSDSSFSSDFGTPAKLPRTEYPSKCWIDLNDTDTSEQNNSSSKQSWKNRASTDVFDRKSKVEVFKGKLRSKLRLNQHSPSLSMS